MNILLIDDEEAFVTTLQERLELRGHVARVALDGASGLQCIAEQMPDVVVLDLRMPGMSGLDVLRSIRKRWPTLPVIILSGHGSVQDFEMCVHLGAVSYHKKPLDIEELLGSVQAAVQRRTSAK